MLRVFVQSTKRILFPRTLPVYTLSAEAATAAHHDVRSHRVFDQPRGVLPLAFHPERHPLLRYNSPLLSNVRWSSEENKEKIKFQVPSPSEVACKMINMLKCVDLTHMKEAPPPVFWLALGVGGTQVVLPMLELIGGYSDSFTIFQLHLAAISVAYLGGVKWGLAVSNNPTPKPDWETMKTVLVPTYVALLGLTLPYPLGFPTVAGALVTSLYLDLKSCAFPPWGNSVRLYLTLSTLAGLFMGLTAYLLFHNRENEEKKWEKKKEAKALEEEEEDKEEKPQKNGKNK